MQSLRAINQNDKANEVELFSQKSANDGRANFKQNTTIHKPLKLIGRYTIEDAGINSIY
jgi:hypothetical protein